MILNIFTQLEILIYSFLSGIIFGLMFDIYRIVRKNSNNIIRILKNLLFWILTSFFVFLFLLYTQYAILGVYTYFYIFLGAIIYLRLVSIRLRSTLVRLLEMITSFIRIILKNLVFSISRIFYKISGKNI